MNKSLIRQLTWTLSVLILHGFAASPACLGQTGLASGAETDSSHWIADIEAAVQVALEQKKMPGAVVCIGNSKQVIYHKAFGYKSLVPEKEKMSPDTVFDLASLTKPIATATSVMILLEKGQVRLRDSVATYLPDFGQNGKRSINVQKLLTHTGGLIPDNALADYQDGADTAFKKIYDLKPLWEPGSRFAYTDVGFIVLGEIVRKQSGMTLDQFAAKNIFQKLGMSETGFNPSEALAKRCAVTQRRGDQWMRGQVHDPRAFELGGIAGHAGLFSTAQDLSLYCQMFLNGGRGHHQQVLSPQTIKLMTRSYSLPGEVKRGLGWDKLSPYSSNRGELMSSSAFGHGGFTGTALWIDPELDLFVIFLSNRVHPAGKGSVNRLAGRIGTIAAAEFSRRQQQNQ